MGKHWLVPLYLDWNGYTPDEVRFRSFSRRVDAVMVPAFGGWYLLQAWLIAGADAADAAAPAFVIGVRLLLAVLAVWVLALQIVAVPSPTASNGEAYIAQQKMARWIYLTRHCLCLQAWHQVFCLLSLASPRLTALSHGVSVWIASLGWFVTIQFYVLVYFSAPFKEQTMIWKENGVQFLEVSNVIHIPPLPTALVDLLLTKEATVLESCFSFQRSYGMLLLYVVFYLAIIFVNFKMTRCWPYGFLNAFGVAQWIRFSVVQVGVLSVFFAVNVLITYSKIRLLA